MKHSIIFFLVIVMLSCSQTQESVKEITFSADAALKFINDYTQSCIELKDPKKWIAACPLLTTDFKKDYKQLWDDAYKADPELGLDFDPIFDAQDFPEKGFKLLSTDETTGKVIVQGIELPTFQVSIKLKKTGDQWLVDGAGVIRMK